MKNRTLAFVGAALATVAAAALTVAPALAKPATAASPNSAKIGQTAPDFTLTDAAGKTHTLSDYTKDGKIVVLEWFNPKCPFVVRHHEAKTTFKDLYSSYKDKNVVFLAVNSSSRESGVYGLDAEYAKKWSIEYPILVDEAGEVGKAYGAKTTPHMYVIDTKGELRYMGAIDNDDRGNKSDSDYVNYVKSALDQVIAGETVATPETKSYGCSVKYKKN